MKTPVALIVFNRPDCTHRVMSRIREARPCALYIIADGPRPNVPSDVAKCRDVISVIETLLDWPCVVEFNCSKQNLGCAERVASGLDWAFSRSERLIVLEDDCLPDLSFFPFCEELLERYAAAHEIGQICGCSRYTTDVKTPFSYIFSRYGPVWGWASWRRAWAHYDLGMSSWPAVKRSGVMRDLVDSKTELELRTALYDKIAASKPSTWDYQWGYAKMVNRMLSVIPRHNMITNIGFDGSGTHMTSETFKLQSKMTTFPLVHPDRIERNRQFDEMYSRRFTGGNAYCIKLKRFVKKFLNGIKQ